MAWYNSGDWASLSGDYASYHLRHILAELAYAINERQALTSGSASTWTVSLDAYPSASDFGSDKLVAGWCHNILNGGREYCESMAITRNNAITAAAIASGDGTMHADADALTTTTNYGPGWYGAGGYVEVSDLAPFIQLREVLEENMVYARYRAEAPGAGEGDAYFETRAGHSSYAATLAWHKAIMSDPSYYNNYWSGGPAPNVTWSIDYSVADGFEAMIREPMGVTAKIPSYAAGTNASATMHLHKLADSDLLRSVTIGVTGESTFVVAAGDDAYVDVDLTSLPTASGTEYEITVNSDLTPTPWPSDSTGDDIMTVTLGDADGWLVTMYNDISGELTYG